MSAATYPIIDSAQHRSAIAATEIVRVSHRSLRWGLRVGSYQAQDASEFPAEFAAFEAHGLRWKHLVLD